MKRSKPVNEVEDEQPIDPDIIDPATKGKKRLRSINGSEVLDADTAVNRHKSAEKKIKLMHNSAGDSRRSKVIKSTAAHESQDADSNEDEDIEESEDEDADDLEQQYLTRTANVSASKTSDRDDEDEEDEDEDDEAGSDDDLDEEGDEDEDEDEDEDQENDSEEQRDNREASSLQESKTVPATLKPVDDEEDAAEYKPPVHEALLAQTGDNTETTKYMTPAQRKAQDERTVFVGNVPVTCANNKAHSKKLKKHFATYGEVESMRFRSIAFSTPSMPRKAAFVTKEFHPDRETMNAYIVYMNKEGSSNGRDSAISAAKSLNATTFMDHSLRVDALAASKTKDKGAARRSIFVGNLPYEVQEQTLWDFFSANAGDVESVRVVRDRKTNLGKGIAYVQFRDRSSVDLAIAVCQTEKVAKRKVRVERCKVQRDPVEEGKDSRRSSILPPGKFMKKKPGRTDSRSGNSLGLIEGVRATKDISSKKEEKGRKHKPRIRQRTQAWKQKTRK